MAYEDNEDGEDASHDGDHWERLASGARWGR